VLARPKFSKFQNFFIRTESLLVEIESRVTKYSASIKLDLIADADDSIILEIANECMADFIITGNSQILYFQPANRQKS